MAPSVVFALAACGLALITAHCGKINNIQSILSLVPF
jgi:hypothetical protein